MNRHLILMVSTVSAAGLLADASAVAEPRPAVVWDAAYSGHGDRSDLPFGLAVGVDGGAYVTGESEGDSTTCEDAATVAYDADGNELWSHRFNGALSRDDAGRAITVDPDGNVYVTGYTVTSPAGCPSPEVTRDALLLKYDPDGNLVCTQPYNGGSGGDEGRSIALDSAGSVYIGAKSVDTYAIVKYSTTPPCDEITAIRDPNDVSPTLNEDPEEFVLDATGNQWVAGRLGGSNPDFFIAKYDSGGGFLCTRPYDGPAHGDDSVHELRTDAAGNAYVTGSSPGVGTGTDLATIKYDPACNELWVRRYDHDGGNDAAFGLAVDASGNIYASGSGPMGAGFEMFTVKYNAAGDEICVASAPSASGLNTRVAIADAGAFLVTGAVPGAGGTDLFVGKYDSDCNEIWTVTYGGLSGGSDGGLFIEPAEDAIFVAGITQQLPAAETDYLTLKLAPPPVPALSARNAVLLAVALSAAGLIAAARLRLRH